MTSDPKGDPRPPRAERRPHEITFHDDTRVDDWYWLREKDNPAVRAHLQAENAYTDAEMARLEPLAEEIYREILSTIQLTDVTFPAPKGEWAYYSRTEEGLQHAIWCRRPRNSPPLDRDRSVLDEHETVLLDENLLAEGHDYLEVGVRALSPDQRLLAYALDTDGSEIMRLRVRDLQSGEDLADTVEGVYYGLAWSSDCSVLFYVRTDESLRPYQIWRHRLGSLSGEDEKVFEENDERFFVEVGSTKDDAFVAIHVESSTTSEWLLIPAADPFAEPAVVEPRQQDHLYSIEHHEGELLVLSNDDAENFALFRTPVTATRRENWELVVPEREDVRLEDLDVIAGYVLLEERGHATTAIRIVPLAGGDDPAAIVLEAPAAGTISLRQNIEFDTRAVRYETSSLIDPPTLSELDLGTGATEMLRRQEVPNYDPSLYRTEQRWARSADGTEVAITLAWHGDRPADPGPAHLYGYGAYGLSIDPVLRLDRPNTPLLDRGVVLAIAHVRGGEELGRRWYLDGKLENKHHSFEDFLAAAHFLVDDGWTTPEQLCIQGASAGGLLVGATVNLDPSAFGAVVAEVPFVDCLTTMLDPTLPLTTNEWEEWGDPMSDAKVYEMMKAYSPYDNVKPTAYPPMFVTGGISDPRVGYFEPAKWVQKLRAADAANEDRILLKMELSAGHFGPSGRYDAWRRRALVLAFILDAIGAGALLQDEPKLIS